MHIRYGYRIDILCEAPTLLITMLDIHPTLRSDITRSDSMVARSIRHVRTKIPHDEFLDPFGNRCRRLTMPAGGAILKARGIIHHSGFPEERNPDAQALPRAALPAAIRPFLGSSRYCETEALAETARTWFRGIDGGWARVTAICERVHQHLRFHAGLTNQPQGASAVYASQMAGSCDFAHLAIAFCRCLDIPARFCRGYLPDIGVDPVEGDQNTGSWFEAYLGDRWWTFDARHNTPRIGYILIARGRDANDTPALQAKGPYRTRLFRMVSEEVGGARYPMSSARRREHSARHGLFAEGKR